MPNNISMDELAKMQAIQDIKEEHKHMLMFRKNLNPIMERLVKRHYILAAK